MSSDGLSPDGVRLDPVEDAVSALAGGEAVVVIDDQDRENEGDLIFAAAMATPELMAFLVRHSSGYVCAPTTAAVLDRLHIPMMTAQNADPFRTAYGVSIDARSGVTTGISAADRSATVRALSDPGSGPDDLVQPGHILPLRAMPGGVLHRPGHTEATVDLLRLADVAPVGVIAELVRDDGAVMRTRELRAFADQHGLRMISIADLITWRRRRESQVRRVSRARLPTAHGEFTALGYVDEITGTEHLALVRGEPDTGAEPPLVRVHSECLTGEALGSRRCDCGPQLDRALTMIAHQERGVLVYLRGHEGRGIGLTQKLRAYDLQDRGRDTVEANLDLGLAVDSRDYAIGAQMLRDLGVATVRLLTNNPDKEKSMITHGVDVVERIGVQVPSTPHSLAYLRTKSERLGHDLPDLPGMSLGTGVR
ncbi:MAG: bifunctional 3,4-dihydroxy-2-butanone-4-phosphate synthase/GTP cyclohydrolase II [Propionibacteriaceae bacterium]